MALCKDHSKHYLDIHQVSMPYKLQPGNIEVIDVKYLTVENGKNVIATCRMQVLAFCPDWETDTYMAKDARGGIFFIPFKIIDHYSRHMSEIPQDFKRCLQALRQKKIFNNTFQLLYGEYKNYLVRKQLVECYESFKKWTEDDAVEDSLALM